MHSLQLLVISFVSFILVGLQLSVLSIIDRTFSSYSRISFSQHSGPANVSNSLLLRFLYVFSFLGISRAWLLVDRSSIVSLACYVFIATLDSLVNPFNFSSSTMMSNDSKLRKSTIAFRSIMFSSLLSGRIQKPSSKGLQMHICYK